MPFIPRQGGKGRIAAQIFSVLLKFNIVMIKSYEIPPGYGLATLEVAAYSSEPITTIRKCL